MRKRLIRAMAALMTALTIVTTVGSTGAQVQAWNGAVNESPNSAHMFQYIDAHGNLHSAEEDIYARHRVLDTNDIQHSVAQAAYTGTDYTVRKGVDVSEWTGSIDWAKVKAGGYDFAFVRIGYTGGRGGQYKDKRGITNLVNAQAAGLDVGVYYFSLATSAAEAAQEAQWVLNQLGGRALQLPVMYDPEYILGKSTRNDNLSGAQFTANAAAFCNTIVAGGYEAGVYANMIFECNLYDMKQLEQFHIWFADYEPKPQSPYYYEYWQYNGKGGSVPGIKGDRIDLNLQFIPTASGLAKEANEAQFHTTGVYTLDNGIPFDANYYLAKYPEVVNEIAGAVTYEELRYNYLHTGGQQGRFPSAQQESAALEQAFAQLSAQTGISVETLRKSYNAQ